MTLIDTRTAPADEAWRPHFADWFDRYDVSAHLASPADACAAFLTGQSSFRHSSLAPEQLLLLDELATIGYQPLRAGFPYHPAALRVPFSKAPAIPAAARCTAQYLAATCSEQFGREVARHLQPLVDATSRHLLLILGSCGAQLYAAARPYLHVPADLGVHVVGLGPVGRLPRDHDLLVLRGRWDALSRTLSRGPGRTVRGGHLTYLRYPEVRAAVGEFGARCLESR